MSRGCVKRSRPRRSTHRPLLQGVWRETCFCSNRKWQVKRRVSVRIRLFACQRKSLCFPPAELVPGHAGTRIGRLFWQKLNTHESFVAF